jgi:hypothetical protein
MRWKRNRFYGSLGREQRYRVWYAVKEGHALTDPDEAAAAVRLARGLLARKPLWRRVMSSPVGITIAGSVIARLVLLSLRGENATVLTWPATLLVFYLLTHVYLWRRWPRGEALLRAERLNCTSPIPPASPSKMAGRRSDP